MGRSALISRLFPEAPPAIRIELIARLLSGSGSINIMAFIAATTSIHAAFNRDYLPASILFMIAVVAVLRILDLRRMSGIHGARPPDLATARLWERRYAIGSFASSIMIGVADLLALSYRDATLALLTMCAFCCYVFSLILRTSVRPVICVVSIAITLIPTLAASRCSQIREANSARKSPRSRLGLSPWC